LKKVIFPLVIFFFGVPRLVLKSKRL
jgi:hypothetical protein